MNLKQALKHYFNYDEFRSGQEEIIGDLLKGNDVLATLPTGGGKSLCYLLPGYLQEGSVVVVSPLLSLMEDQVQQLKSSGEKSVVALNSFLKSKEKKQVLQNLNSFRFIYVSPEILQSKEVIDAFHKVKVSFFVVDEAHCVSQWGHDFRTDYLKLKDVCTKLGSPPCLALTATASPDVQTDIIKQLGLTKVIVHTNSVDRPNIAMMVEKAVTIDEKVDKMLSYIDRLQGPGIIYCATRAWAEKLCSHIKLHGIEQVAYYHGGLENEERILIQQQFINNQLRFVCSTNAFGMGVNKADVRFVLHFHYPIRLESYLQEIGRAGRDGKPSLAVLLYCPQDDKLPAAMIQGEVPNENELDVVIGYLKSHPGAKINDTAIQELIELSEVKWNFLKLHIGYDQVGVREEIDLLADRLKSISMQRLNYKQTKLNAMKSWIETKDCRRTAALSIFAETPPKVTVANCCDRCGIDITAFGSKKNQLQSLSYEGWRKEWQRLLHL